MDVGTIVMLVLDFILNFKVESQNWKEDRAKENMRHMQNGALREGPSSVCY